MPADALNYLYITNELNSVLSGGRIDKITMPEPDEIVLNVRANARNYSLTVSASPELARCHLITRVPGNPVTAPAFLMHLRKHIGGANITGVKLQPYERVIEIGLSAKNEMGFTENKVLISEIMGKYSNIILVNSDGKISDSIKRITLDTSAKRQILPGLTYNPAPSQDKINISETEKLKDALSRFEGGRLDNYLLKNLSGLAPSTISQAVFSAIGALTLSTTLDCKAQNAVFSELKNLYEIKKINPCIFLSGGEYADFGFTEYNYSYSEFKYFPTLNEALDEYYFGKQRTKRLNEKSHKLVTVLKNAISRTEKKLANFMQLREDANNLEKDKLFGELITANMYRIKQGLKFIEVENYYCDPPETICIPLDENKSPQFNAQRYYKKYAKKKKTIEMTNLQIAEAEGDLEYYQSVLFSFQTLKTLAEIEETAEEMRTTGIIAADKSVENKKASSKNGKKALNIKSTPKTPPSKIVYNGYNIIYGRNNTQNDGITKAARASDVWLHTQKIHGCHVIIENNNSTEFPADDVLLKAAAIAAGNSKASSSENVPVDYTFAKFVSKPRGAAPGKVIYVNQKTLYVKPEKHER